MSTGDPHTEAAIEWLVVLNAGQGAPRDGAGEHARQAFARWLAADPRNHDAWTRIAGAVDLTFGQFRQAGSGQADLIEATLRQADRKTGRRRQLLRGALALAGVGAGSAFIAERHLALPALGADLRTATAERQRFTLDDGSVLTLNARGGADIDYRADARHVHLRQGELIAEVAPPVRSQAAWPFIVHTRHGSVRAAAGARFLVRREDDRSYACALAQHIDVAAQAPAPLPARALAAGQGAWFDARGVHADPSPTAVAHAAWERGLLEVHDATLADVVARLRPYRHGFIRVAPRIAALRVFGTYSLDDTDQALASLAQTLPITVHTQAGGWLVRLDAAG